MIEPPRRALSLVIVQALAGRPLAWALLAVGLLGLGAIFLVLYLIGKI